MRRRSGREQQAPPSGRAAAVDVQRIVRTAVEIADSEGLSATTMRTVAARLGVSAMALYHHLDGENELVLLMEETAFGELKPRGGTTHWRDRLEIGARTMWTLYRQHPWLAQPGPLNRPLPLASIADHSEWALSAMADAGLDRASAFSPHLVLHSFVDGVAVNLKRELHAESTSGLSGNQWFGSRAPSLGALSQSHPTFAAITGRLHAVNHRFDLDELFEPGL